MNSIDEQRVFRLPNKGECHVLLVGGRATITLPAGAIGQMTLLKPRALLLAK